MRTTLWVVRGPSIAESHTTAKWLKCVTPLRTWVDEPEVRDDVYRSTQEYSGPPSSQVRAASKRHPVGGLSGLWWNGWWKSLEWGKRPLVVDFLDFSGVGEEA